MKRWLLAVALLVGGAASVSYADYVLMRAVLGGQQRPDGTNPGASGGPVNPPGRPGGPPGGPPGRPGPPPGGPGNPGGGEGGIPGLGGGMTNIDTAALAV